MAQAQITPDKVKKIAQLAKLKLSAAEIAKFTPQLSEVISYISQLSEIVDKPLPVASKRTTNVSRSDEVYPSLTSKSALNQSNSTQDNYFITQAVIDND